MNFLYLDESGTPSFNDPTPIFAIVGVDIDESKNRQLTYEYTLLKKTYFPHVFSTELRAVPNIKDKVRLLKQMECKNILEPGSICYPNRKFIYKTIKLCAKHGVRLFGVVARKDRLSHKDRPNWELYPACLKIITTRYHMCLEKTKSRGALIMDARGDALDDTLTLIQSSFLLWGKTGRLVNTVSDLPFFAPSHLSAALQIAHYFSYITALHYKFIYNQDLTYKYLTPLWLSMAPLFYGEPKGQEIIFWG